MKVPIYPLSLGLTPGIESDEKMPNPLDPHHVISSVVDASNWQPLDRLDRLDYSSPFPVLPPQHVPPFSIHSDLDPFSPGEPAGLLVSAPKARIKLGPAGPKRHRPLV